MRRAPWASLNRLLGRLGLAVVRRPHRDRFWTLDACARHPPDIMALAVGVLHTAGRPVTFLQVGANDGETDDPLRRVLARYALRGLFVEPQPGPLARLRARHAAAGDRLQFAPVAVDDTDGDRVLYAFDRDEEAGLRLDLFASFDREQVERHRRTARLTANIVPRMVPTRTLATLRTDYALPTPDVLVVDAEGHDAAIMAQVDLVQWRPAVIQFEHVNLPLSDHLAVLTRLVEAGYGLAAMPTDTVAIRGDLPAP